MDEQTWQINTDPEPMLDFLRGRASRRKLRLFAVACCRRVWQRIADERSRRAGEVAERGADGQVTEGELEAARDAARDVADGTAADAAMAAWGAVSDAVVGVRAAARTAAQGVGWGPAWDNARDAAR